MILIILITSALQCSGVMCPKQTSALSNPSTPPQILRPPPQILQPPPQILRPPPLDSKQQ